MNRYLRHFIGITSALLIVGCATSGHYRKQAQEAAARGDHAAAFENAELSLGKKLENPEAKAILQGSAKKLVDDGLARVTKKDFEADLRTLDETDNWCERSAKFGVAPSACGETAALRTELRHLSSLALEGEGDAAFTAKDYAKAVTLFTRAQAMEPREPVQAKLKEATDLDLLQQAEKSFSDATSMIERGELRKAYYELGRCQGLRPDFRPSEVAALRQRCLELGRRTFSLKAVTEAGMEKQLLNELSNILALDTAFFSKGGEGADFSVEISIDGFEDPQPETQQYGKQAYYVSVNGTCIDLVPVSYTVVESRVSARLQASYAISRTGVPVSRNNVEASDSDSVQYAVNHSGADPSKYVEQTPLNFAKCYDNFLGFSIALAAVLANPIPEVDLFSARQQLSRPDRASMVRRAAQKMAAMVQSDIEQYVEEGAGFDVEAFLGSSEGFRHPERPAVPAQVAETEPPAPRSAALPIPSGPAERETLPEAGTARERVTGAGPTSSPGGSLPGRLAESVKMDPIEGSIIRVVSKQGLLKEGMLVLVYETPEATEPCGIARILAVQKNTAVAEIDGERSRCKFVAGMKSRVVPAY